jgi:hypothetical protein
MEMAGTKITILPLTGLLFRNFACLLYDVPVELSAQSPKGMKHGVEYTSPSSVDFSNPLSFTSTPPLVCDVVRE